ncbi:hypothetical protein FQZ97_941350 [compost metagenome]
MGALNRERVLPICHITVSFLAKAWETAPYWMVKTPGRSSGTICRSVAGGPWTVPLCWMVSPLPKEFIPAMAQVSVISTLPLCCVTWSLKITQPIIRARAPEYIITILHPISPMCLSPKIMLHLTGVVSTMTWDPARY